MDTSILDSPILNGDRIMRFGGDRDLVRESLYDHLGKMSGMAILLHEHIDFDLKEVLYRIQLHDLEEMVTQDVSRKLKHYNKDIKRAIDEASFAILRKEIHNEELIKQIQSAKSHDTIEGCIVHLLDVYQAYQHLRFEVKMLGNKSLDDTLVNDCTPYLQETYAEICECFPVFKSISKLIPEYKPTNI